LVSFPGCRFILDSEGGVLMTERGHLEHLPGLSYLLVVALAAVAALVVSLSQLIGSQQTIDTVVWGLVTGAATVSLISLAVAWEERRAHIHALVRRITDEGPSAGTEGHRASEVTELLRLGARREFEFLDSRRASNRESR
jgi:hypothetical protein